MQPITEIFYKNDFSFEYAIELDPQYDYSVILHTAGMTGYAAEISFKDGEWVGTYCSYENGVLTIDVSQHNLPKGKLFGHICVSKDNKPIEYISIEPQIFLVNECLCKDSQQLLPDEDCNDECCGGSNQIVVSDIDIHQNEVIDKLKQSLEQLKDDLSNQSQSQVRSYTTKEELFTDIENGVKFYHYDRVVVAKLEYTFYQDCNEVGEDRLNLFTALPLYPSLGGFTRVDVRDDNDEWPYFIQACYTKAKALGVSNQHYILEIALVPRAAVAEPYYDNYYLHGYLTEPWSVPNSGDAGCLVWYWDIDINNEAAFAIYVVPSTRKISHLTAFEGSSPNLFKFYKEYTTKVASLIPTSARVQVTGTSTTNIMSQKAVTDELNKKADATVTKDRLNWLDDSVMDIQDVLEKVDANIVSLKTSKADKEEVAIKGNIGVYSERITLDEPDPSNSIDTKVTRLKIWGHEKLLEMGYVPVIFRYTHSANQVRVRHDSPDGEDYFVIKVRRHHKGWNAYGNPECVRITDDGTVEFSTNPPDDLGMEPKGFSPDAENMIRERYDENSGRLFVRHGRKKILIKDYDDYGGRHRTVRLRYAIGFIMPPKIAWPNDPFRKITPADLVSNLAEFYIGYHYKTQNEEGHSVFGWDFVNPKTV